MKNWSTRKKTLFFAITAVMIYALSDMALTFIYACTGTQMYFDPTLTSEFFDFMKLISGLGGGLTAAEILADTVKSFSHKKESKEEIEEDIESDEEAQG